MERLHKSFRRSRTNTEVGKFYSVVQEITKLLDELSNTVEAVKRKQHDMLGIPRFPNDSRKQELHDLHEKAKFLSKKARSKLQDMSTGIKQSERSSCSYSRDSVISVQGIRSESVISFPTAPENSKYVPAIHKIKKNQQSLLFKRYIDIMADYHAAQIDHRSRVKRRLIHQMEIMDHPYTDDELETMIDKGTLTAYTHLINTETHIAERNLEEIHDRHDDFLKLEESIRELSDLFKELAIIVENQGGVVDNIEKTVMSTSDYVDSGSQHIKKAEKIKAWTRKKKAYLYTVGSTGAAVTLIVAVVLCLL